MLSIGTAGAEIPSEQLDPTNFLVAPLSKPLSWRAGINMPNVPGAQAAELSSAEQGSPAVAEISNSQIGRQLQQARITVPKSEKDKGNKNELQQIIKQIQSVEFKPQKDASEPTIVIEPVPTTEPNETLLGAEAAEDTGEKGIESKPEATLPYESITDQTLQMLKNLSQHPEQLDNPFELGEVLFLSSHLEEAKIFYQQALNRKDADDVGSAQDRAWILFQIGNCLRDRDQPMAIEMYRQLITEYPESTWTNLAKTQDRLINWYQKDNPWGLTKENQF